MNSCLNFDFYVIEYLDERTNERTNKQTNPQQASTNLG